MITCWPSGRFTRPDVTRSHRSVASQSCDTVDSRLRPVVVVILQPDRRRTHETRTACMLLATAVLLPPRTRSPRSHQFRAPTRSRGVVAPTCSPELAEVIRAQGAMLLENPCHRRSTRLQRRQAELIRSRPPSTSKPQDRARQEHLPPSLGQRGADPTTSTATTSSSGPRSGRRPGYITRSTSTRCRAPRDAHGTKDVTGKSLPVFDGSTWIRGPSGCCSPSRRQRGRRVAGDLDFRRRWRISRALGRAATRDPGGSDGNLWIVEDVGGARRVQQPCAATEQLRVPLQAVQSKDCSRGRQLQCGRIIPNRDDGASACSTATTTTATSA